MFILDPPSPPIISGYMEGQIIPAGSVQKLLCVSSGGNPLATLTWYKNDKKVSYQVYVTQGFIFKFYDAKVRNLQHFKKSHKRKHFNLPNNFFVWYTH